MAKTADTEPSVEERLKELETELTAANHYEWQQAGKCCTAAFKWIEQYRAATTNNGESK